MQRATPLDTSLRAYSSGGSRGIVQEVDKKRKDDNKENPPEKEGDPDETFMQELKISMMKNEERHNVEHPQNYGFTSHSIKADKVEQGKEDEAAAAEHFVQFMGGNRSFPVVQNLDDRRVRLRHLAEGEVCVYDDQQQKIHIQRERILTRSQFVIEQRVILDEPKNDGHGWHKKASRDQTKDKSLRLSTIRMDDKNITIVRTKPKEEKQEQKEEKDRSKQGDKWQEGGDKGSDNPEKDIQNCSSLQLGEKKISLITYNKDGDPHLVIELDEETAQINLMTLESGRKRFEMTVDDEGFSTEQHERPEEGKPGLHFEMDDQFRRILLMTVRDEKPQLVLELDGPKDKLTIKTNGKTEQVFDNASSMIHIHADTVVKVGDRDADIPAAIKGSVDSMGHRLVKQFAQKVLLK